MTDPRIRRYREAILQMASGQLDVPLEVSDPTDELGELGGALAHLAAALRRQLEEATRLEQITDRINAGLTLEDTLNHVYESFRQLIPYDRMGFAVIEDRGQTVRAVWSRSEAPRILIGADYSAPLKGSSLQRVIDTGQPRIINDLEEYLERRPDSDSTRRIVEEGIRSSLTCPLVNQGAPVGFLFFSSTRRDAYRDSHVELYQRIAGRLSMMLEKSRLYQELLELDLLKNRFLGVAAHDLRHPVGVIKGYVALLGGGALGELSSEQHRMLSSIERVSDAMLSLIDDLLDVNAIESGELVLHCENVDLQDFLKGVVDSHRLLAAAKRIRLQLELEPDLPQVRLDPKRVSQILDNLLTNAVKYSHPDTTIQVGAERAGASVHIRVSDQGQGIPTEDLPGLFGDFSRGSTRPTAGENSTGLGLAIVKRLVEAHQGRIWVASTAGEGSTFTFALPIRGGGRTARFRPPGTRALRRE